MGVIPKVPPPRRVRQGRIDPVTGWWQNLSGDWFRDTPQGDHLDKLFDRCAERYVDGTYSTVEYLERQLDNDIKRFLAPRQGATGATGASFPSIPDPAFAVEEEGFGIPLVLKADPDDTPFVAPPLQEIGRSRGQCGRVRCSEC